MNTSILQQFRLIRGFTLEFEKILEESDVDQIPDGYNNNIRWNIGHLLVTPYLLLYGLDEAMKRMPEQYRASFARGTSPKDWQGDLPSLATLFKQLRIQMEQVEQDFSHRLDEPLPQVFSFGEGKDIRTYGELLIFIIYHEGWHCGYIRSMMHDLKK